MQPVIESSSLTVQQGKPMPLGASLTQNGVNFCVFSRNGTSVFLDIFREEEDELPYFTYEFSPESNRTGDLWHVHIQGLTAGALYLYRVDGPFKPEKGMRFNKNNYLFDPYAKAFTRESVFKNLPKDYGTSLDFMDIQMGKPRSAKGFPKCVVIDDDFDWQGDRPINYPMRNSILYETHLKGFTQSQSSQTEHPGTYRGMIEKIPYLKELGITSVELLPIQEFDEHENSNTNPRTGSRLTNYWGYSTIGFFAPKATFAADKSPGGAVREFKEMVREMHKAGIEVILDIVFNHTAEGNEHGITLNFRGFDNSIYYILDEDKRFYKNFSGCGNTFNCNHPIVRTFIIECLRYWVADMHIDGFRFDLGSILGRDQNGQLMENPPILERIAEEPLLRNTKIIAEAWDAGGAYQVGSFPGGRWSEWNDRFRDDMRKYWRGDAISAGAAATRFAGSSDLYLRDGRKPFHSINFITSHDGFTLNDLVSYNGKHNDENGESSRDGSDNNCSYNYGYEGESQNRSIEKIRTRQIKNFLLSLMLAQGTPMLLAGDEFRRTQHGNNNAYCQDNEISWINWTCKDRYAEIFRFARHIIAFRLNHPVFRRPEFFTGKDNSFNSLPDITWFDEHGRTPDWSQLDHFIAYRLDGHRAETLADVDDNIFYIMCNASDKDVSVKLPLPPEGKKWVRCIDTSADAPADFLLPGEEESLTEQSLYVLPGKSGAVLSAK